MNGRNGPSRRKIEEQAILRLIALGDDPSAQAAADLHGWIARDPAHAVAFARAELAWEQTARLKAGAALRPAPPARTLPARLGPLPGR